MLRGEVKRGEDKRLRVTLSAPRQFGRGERVVHRTGKENATARDEQSARRALEVLGIPVAE